MGNAPSSEAEDALPSSAGCWCFLAHAVPYPSKCQSRAGALAPSGALHPALVALHRRLPQQLLPGGSWGSDPQGPLVFGLSWVLTLSNDCQQLPFSLRAVSVFCEHILPFQQARVKLVLLRG